ncbi:MAG: c-type cytochrome [Roseovarius sp.]
MAGGDHLLQWAGIAGLIALLAGCGAEAVREDVSRNDFEAGRLFYEGYCSACHGPEGRGDGRLARELPRRPADLTRLSARNGGAFPWSRVMAQVHGYEGRSEIMPEYGTVFDGPKVTWRDERGTRIETPEALLQLARYLESIQES